MTTLPSRLPHDLTRTVVIHAPMENVFRYFTDSSRWATWWGAGSSIDATVGGAMHIRYPGGIEVAGEVLEVAAPSRIVFTYGFVSGTPIAAGSSRITIELSADAAGTKLNLRHEFAEADAKVRDEHVQGWRYQLSVFANVVADERYAGATDTVDRWFGAWAEPDSAIRAATLAEITGPEILFSDRYSCLETRDDLLAHITASQRFMPGIRMQRIAKVRHCQGMVLADWSASGADGATIMQGANVFVFGPTGRLEAVTGFA